MFYILYLMNNDKSIKHMALLVICSLSLQFDSHINIKIIIKCFIKNTYAIIVQMLYNIQVVLNNNWPQRTNVRNLF